MRFTLKAAAKLILRFTADVSGQLNDIRFSFVYFHIEFFLYIPSVFFEILEIRRNIFMNSFPSKKNRCSNKLLNAYNDISLETYINSINIAFN